MAIVSFIYFLPVLFIIFTAIKPQDMALSVPPTLSPTSIFGLIPEPVCLLPDAGELRLRLLARR